MVLSVSTHMLTQIQPNMYAVTPEHGHLGGQDIHLPDTEQFPGL